MTPSQETEKKLRRFKDIFESNADLTYKEACARAGLNYRTAYRYYGPGGRRLFRGHKFTRETALVAFKQAVSEMGYVPTSIQYVKAQPPQVSHMTLFRLFGTWDALLEAAGFEPIRWRQVGLPAKMRLTHSDLKRLALV